MDFSSRERVIATPIVIAGLLLLSGCGGGSDPIPARTTTTTATTTAQPTSTPTVTKTMQPTVTKTVTTAATKTRTMTVTETVNAATKDAYFENCTAARAAGAAPLYSADPGYRSGLDRDGDGVACE